MFTKTLGIMGEIQNGGHFEYQWTTMKKSEKALYMYNGPSNLVNMYIRYS
jgi:hypothetical protein